MPSPELNYAIDHTDLSRLQNVLRRVCDASPTAQALVEAELLAPSASINVIDLTADENNRPVHPVTNTSSVKDNAMRCARIVKKSSTSPRMQRIVANTTKVCYLDLFLEYFCSLSAIKCGC